MISGHGDSKPVWQHYKVTISVQMSQGGPNPDMTLDIAEMENNKPTTTKR